MRASRRNNRLHVSATYGHDDSNQQYSDHERIRILLRAVNGATGQIDMIITLINTQGSIIELLQNRVKELESVNREMRKAITDLEGAVSINGPVIITKGDKPIT